MADGLDDDDIDPLIDIHDDPFAEPFPQSVPEEPDDPPLEEMLVGEPIPEPGDPSDELDVANDVWRNEDELSGESDTD